MPDLQQIARDVLDELNDRYDGAPDSTTLWMGRHIEALTAALPAPYSPPALETRTCKDCGVTFMQDRPFAKRCYDCEADHQLSRALPDDRIS